MTPKLILRWEDPETHLGPYGTLPAYNLCYVTFDGEPGCELTWTCSRHPAPYYDGLGWDTFTPPPGKDRYDGRFGFRSIEQMNNWFPKRIQERLQESGYVLATYKATKILYGGHQVYFWPDGEPIEGGTLE